MAPGGAVKFAWMLVTGRRHPNSVRGRDYDMAASKKTKYRSSEVTRHSQSLDLEVGVFAWNDPKRIARSLRDSAEKSTRRKGTPFQSAMSMLNFYTNRAGRNLNARQKTVLAEAKDELRKLCNRAAETQPKADSSLRSE